VLTRVLTPVGGSVASFVPAVAALDQGGECETLSRGISGRDETLVILSFPDRRNTRRNVSLAFDGQGRLLRYNDLRGDLRSVKTGPQTSIVIDWETQSAIASNEGPGSHAPAVLGTPEQFLRQSNLGSPEQLIEQVKSRCATP
jgi:hypothetical protein